MTSIEEKKHILKLAPPAHLGNKCRVSGGAAWRPVLGANPVVHLAS